MPDHFGDVVLFFPFLDKIAERFALAQGSCVVGFAAIQREPTNIRNVQTVGVVALRAVGHCVSIDVAAIGSDRWKGLKYRVFTILVDYHMITVMFPPEEIKKPFAVIFPIALSVGGFTCAMYHYSLNFSHDFDN